MKEKISGIYCIENIINGKKYIGQTKDWNKRERSHRGALRRGDSDSYLLQKEWDEYGETNFSFYMIEKCFSKKLDDELNNKEKYYIKNLRSYMLDGGYNQTMGGKGSDGYIQSEDSRKLISVNHADVSKDKNPNYGISMPLEQREKISMAKKGISPSLETIANMIKNHPHLKGVDSPIFGRKPKNSTSVYHGVIKRTARRKNVGWEVVINKKHIGNYKSEIDAAIAYDKYIIEHDLPNPLNFPERRDEFIESMR